MTGRACRPRSASSIEPVGADRAAKLHRTGLLRSAALPTGALFGGLRTVISLALALVLHTNQLTPPSWISSLRVGGREAALLLASAALTIPSWRCSACCSRCWGSGSLRASWR